ncbi:MAG: hypothetical protein ABI273_05025 [Lacunisphaera sp.]
MNCEGPVDLPHSNRDWFPRKKIRLFGLCLVLGCVAVAACAADDGEQKDAVPSELRDLRQKLSSVKEWQGVWEVSVGGGVTEVTPGGSDLDSHYEEKTHGSFLLKRFQRDWDPRRGTLSWQGEGEAVGRGRGNYSSWRSSYGARVGEEWEQSYAGSMPQKQVEFSIWLGGKSRNVTLHPGNWTDKDVPRITRTGRQVFSPNADQQTEEKKIAEQSAKPVMVWYLGSGQAANDRKWQVVSGGSDLLEFVWDDVGAAPGSQSFGEHTGTVRKRSRVLLFPVYDNLEVEVTIDGYDEWRPKGTIADPKKPGNNLAVRATLKNKDGTPGTDLPPVRRFTFELIDTSREPGVCLNWPLNAQDNDPDLRLATAVTGGELSKEDQKLVVKTVPKDEQQQPYADAQVDSYDFGGRAELRVTCELEDGREVIGLLKDDQGGADIVRLPKTNGPGWVAESWRQQKGVSDLQDNDDDEKVEGQDYKGDGFTLYEEYRGFVENGVHVEGDPKKKDLFILNLADVSTRNGISLLEQLAKVRTHARLRDGKEMTQEARLMNGNHRAAPHRVDQHGVVLSHVGMGKGGYTSSIEGADDKKAFRPRYTNWVYIESPDSRWGLFSSDVLKRYGLEHLSPSQLYAAAVAHELLHAIGVDHHGESRMSVLWGYFQRADNPRNPTHRPRFTVGTGSSQALTLLWEDTQGSVADGQQAMFDHYVANSAAGGMEVYRDAAEYWCNYLTFVGPSHGTDSGDESCVMRYYFATAYATTGSQDKFYVIRPGAKQAAAALCTSAKGTGGNAASHQPQSRFGDAAGGRGDCFSQVCPNDAIPPRSIAIK